jgi:hypothetical protein
MTSSPTQSGPLARDERLAINRRLYSTVPPAWSALSNDRYTATPPQGRAVYPTIRAPPDAARIVFRFISDQSSMIGEPPAGSVGPGIK